ncbi:MAG: tRNA (guanosine(46)-N7)-methyltransferase TrmB [Bacteroidales bacterium]|nr:tRNA (guanosine(46)-N7)-methyltransferase TrmB [Bacteroidales bacterium]
MGHDKLRKFAENESFSCLLQPSAEELLRDGYFALRDHEVKGHWGGRFANPAAPLVLELGCGKGEYTIALAERYPDKNYVGVDIKGARLWKGAKYATQRSLGNVGFLRTRIEFISAFFAPGEVSEVWLTFSDPQVRSENSRLTSPVFLERYSRFLAPGGLIHLKTDSQFLYQYTLAVCRANKLPVLASSEDLYAEAAAFDPCLTEVQTFYESMFREQGYPIKYLCFTLGGEDGAAESGRGTEKPSAPTQREWEGPASESAAGGMDLEKRPVDGFSNPVFRTSSCAAEPSSPTFVSPSEFDPDYWRSVEGNRTLFGRDTAETRRQKLRKSK